jgi:hypothetical protein
MPALGNLMTHVRMDIPWAAGVGIGLYFLLRQPRASASIVRFDLRLCGYICALHNGRTNVATFSILDDNLGRHCFYIADHNRP